MSASRTKRTKPKPLPPHIVSQYEDGARGFKKLKRQQLKDLEDAYGKLRIGCAFFPDGGYQQMNVIEKAMDDLFAKLSEKEWGR